MLLEKWYLDAIFPDGTVWFGYRARLSLWPYAFIPWASGCEVLPDGRVRAVSPWKNVAEPRLESGQWVWKGPDGFDASWTPQGRAAESALGSDEQFKVRWNCLAPMASVTRTFGNQDRSSLGANSSTHGSGYLEHLRLELSRPELPFRQLWWGRAHAGQSSLVWIRWGDGRELTALYEDGVEVNGKIEPLPQGGVRVQTSRGVWVTETGQTLCDRDLRRSFPGWLVSLAGKITPERELKLAGPVRFRTGSHEFTGAALWENVRWS